LIKNVGKRFTYVFPAIAFALSCFPKPMRSSALRLNFLLLMVLSAVLSAGSVQAGSSLSLNGSSQYVSTPTDSAFIPPSKGTLTLEAWINIPFAQQGTIISVGDGNSSSTDYILQIGNNGGGGGSLLSFFAGQGWDSSMATIPFNTWTHVAVTYN